MATYKVIQDIEAEDKFLGPLTLKQFIFGGAGVFFGYLSFFAVTQGATFMLAILLPPMLLGFFLAIPWSSQQSTEVWLLAKFRYYLKPKIRIWNQSGLEELVTITVPKKIEKQLTDGLDQAEVRSRLKALAETIDTRGWATKNATYATGYNYGDNQTSERLINPSTIPREVPEIDETTVNDVMDDSNFVSEKLEHMIETSAAERRQQSLEMMDRIRQGEAPSPQAVQFTPPIETDEALLSEQLKSRADSTNISNSHLRTLPVNPASPVPTQPAKAPMTASVNPDIINHARNNDLDVATIARQLNKKDTDDEVVVSLR